MPFDPAARRRLRRRFQRLPEEVRDEMMAALEENAEELTQAIKRAAPVRRGPKGGALRDSVRWRYGRTKERDTTGAISEAGADSDMVVRVIAGDREAFYAAWVEFGRRARAAAAPRQNKNYRRTVVMTRALSAVSYMPAQPFFFPTYRALRKRLLSRLRRRVNKAIKESGR